MVAQAGWPRRQRLAFGTKLKQAYLASIEDRVPGLVKALESARRDWAKPLVKAGWLTAKKAAPEDIPLTAFEIDELRRIIQQLSGQPYALALYDHLRVIVQSGYANAKDLLDIKAELSGIPQSFAMEQLRQRVDEFSFLVNQREQVAFNATLDQALADGWTPKRLSSEVQSLFDEGYHITDSAGNIEKVMPTDAWADTVARTELSRAQQLGQDALYKAAGVQRVQYVTTQGATVCDECADYDGEVYAIDDAPEIPVHPNCCCSYTPYDEDLRYDEQADAADNT